MITTIYLLVAEFGAPSIYNYWAVLSLDIFLVIMWLCSFAVQAAEIAPILADAAIYESGTDCSYYDDCTANSAALGVLDTQAAVAGIGGLEL